LQIINRIAVLLAVGLTAIAGAAQAATGTGTATVALGEAPLSITQTNGGIRFGTITPSGGANDQTWVCFPNGLPAAHFDVTGQPYAAIVFTTPNSATLTGPGFTLDMTTFYQGPTDVSSTNTGAQPYTLSDTGAVTIGVCGLLLLPGGVHIPPGEYTGTFPVTADYQ
jgi:hypothetical protein